MSKLSDYSKFDKLDVNNSDEESDREKPTATVKSTTESLHTKLDASSASQIATGSMQPITPSSSMRKNPENGRFIYEYDGKPVYEWEQSLEEVILYIPAPPVKASEIHCKILPKGLQLGIEALVKSQQKYFLNEATFGTVEVSESTWTLEDGVLVVYLAKANKGQVWDVALVQQQSSNSNTVTLDPLAKQQVQEQMMLERFQEENPGFDFRGATFNGSAPDPRTFMGGVKYS